MAINATITGNIGQDAILKYTKTGKPVLNISVNATPRKRLEDDTWENHGEPIWIEATFWNEYAEHYADILEKGQRVRLEGTLMMKAWTTEKGEERQHLEVMNPRLFIIPNLYRDRDELQEDLDQRATNRPEREEYYMDDGYDNEPPLGYRTSNPYTR
ncbi:single-stranded DNA-binding protein [Actinotignum urinale]|uniref:single-stranded DNA-binding protein n=1 Tax=Actinotignum urinale TaxID=190146 RepID=UPI0003B32EC1|nr:single-stranded DNA-binding protein [Actinotignum urinale]MDY5160980.1 single-stranded DNA-binding protein [Actinotignum urinale]